MQNRNTKYKAFYVSDEQHVEVNAILKECQELTLKQIKDKLRERLKDDNKEPKG